MSSWIISETGSWAKYVKQWTKTSVCSTVIKEMDFVFGPYHSLHWSHTGMWNRLGKDKVPSKRLK